MDAALDRRNVSIVVNYIKEGIKNAQFDVISFVIKCSNWHNNWYGFTKLSSKTMSISLKNNEFFQR